MGGVVTCTVKTGDNNEPLLLLWNCKDETLRCTSTHLRGDTSQFGLSLSDPLTDAVEEEGKKTQVVASLCPAPSTVRAHSACKATISSDVQYYSHRLSPSKHPYSRD